MDFKKTNQTNKTKLIDTENRLVVATREGSWGVGEMGEGDQEVQTSRYKIIQIMGVHGHPFSKAILTLFHWRILTDKRDMERLAMILHWAGSCFTGWWEDNCSSHIAATRALGLERCGPRELCGALPSVRLLLTLQTLTWPSCSSRAPGQLCGVSGRSTAGGSPSPPSAAHAFTCPSFLTEHRQKA